MNFIKILPDPSGIPLMGQVNKILEGVKLQAEKDKKQLVQIWLGVYLFDQLQFHLIENRGGVGIKQLYPRLPQFLMYEGIPVFEDDRQMHLVRAVYSS